MADQRVILVPNCNNPLGFIMPDARKRAVLNLAQRYDIVIFEDDIYGELATEYPRPRTIHSWDIDGRVMLCSSFTKTIAPGCVSAGSPRALLRQAATDEVRRQRDQRPLHSAGGLQFYSRRPLPPPRAADAADLSAQYRDLHLLAAGIFPCGICVTRPKGGFMLWVELPEQVDMVCVAKQLCRLKIQVAPGSLFSAAGKYRNCVRINCALPPTEKHKAVMVKLGEAVKVAME